MLAGAKAPAGTAPFFKGMKTGMSRSRVGLMLMLLCLLALPARAFTLIGPNDPTGQSATGTLVLFNFPDTLGRPVPIKEFYRWNYPQLTYAFDSTFVRYFGHNGMAAVSNAFRVLNDFFEPEDSSYTNGVSSMDLILEYDGHNRSWDFNPTANLENVTDMQSMVLGLLVNQLGLGNPHRYAFIIHDVLSYNAAAAGSTGTFHVTLRNYDPYTYRPTSKINGVNYGYWLYNDSPTAPANITVWDAIEYSVGSDDEYSAIAGIRDVINFGGLAWPGPAPTVFRTPGVYFRPDDSSDGPLPLNRTANRDQPRHTLTFDDAGGLRYLYRTNNIVIETLDASVTLVTPANMNPPTQLTSGAVPPNSPFLTPQIRTVAGLPLSGVVPTPPAGGTLRPQPTAIIRQALRGGINKIKYKYTAFDSLLGSAYNPQSAVWNDVIITNALPTDTVPASPPYFLQVVQRTTTVPDIIFIANDLGVAGNVLPVISLPDTTGWAPLIAPNSQSGATANLLGPGSILNPGANTSIQYIFTTRAPFHQIIWAGEPGIEGNFIKQFQWGWVTNTGPEDFIAFPESDITQAEAITGPSAEIPSITAISVIDGTTQDYKSSPFTGNQNGINRTRDTVFIYGRRTDSITAIEVLNTAGTTIMQTIDPRPYIISDQLIKLSPGAFNNNSEGTNLKIRLVNSVGKGSATDLGDILAGIPLITSTQYDGLPFNTRKSMIIEGSGFLTKAGASISHIEIYDDMNATNYEHETAPVPFARVPVTTASVTMTDTKIIIPADYFTDHNATMSDPAAGLYGATMGMLNTRVRSDGNSTNATLDVYARQIRLYRSDGVRSLHRPNAHKWSHVGVGGSRIPAGNRIVTPYIVSVQTDTTLPAGLTASDANATWTRSDNNDVLIIRGHGLDLAFSIEFVDGEGHLIQATDGNGLPPAPISLRNGVEPSALAPGVTIVAWDDPSLTADADGFEIRIAPLTFGMNANPLFDSIAANNVSTQRRVVIRTPFGTAIAPPSQYILIQN